MEKNTTINGIVFRCYCGIMVDGEPTDTLMSEEQTETNNADMYTDFIGNSPHDPAGNIVEKDCPQCNLNFLTLFRIGANETTMYSCSCGYISTHENYVTPQ